MFGGATIADSQRAKILHETGHLPLYYIPQSDVRMDLLEPTEHRTHCPFKGDARYWSVRVGEAVTENAVWSYPESVAGAPPLAGYLAFRWQAMDAWFEEDEEIIGLPRDPYHRIDVRRSSRRVVVHVAGQRFAETHRPMLLFETSLPIRYYIPRADVCNDRLIASVKRTVCLYKGRDYYWSVRAGGSVVEDLVWSYQEPLAEAEKIAGYVCLAQEHAEVVIPL
ncbi:MAG: DUF427 domain-containing protein [Candidatus Paceibacterota bacterium]